jgi:hypothetical protein
MTRTALCTLAVGRHLELLELARPSLVGFAQRHGYEYVEHARSLAPDRPASWSKVVALHHLAGSFDRVIWVDSDAVVVDGRDDLAAQLRPGRVLATVVHRHDGNALPNLGVAVARGGGGVGGRATRRLLERLWSCTDLIDHPWWENAALLRVLGLRTFEPVQPIAPARLHPWRLAVQELDGAWNSIPDHPAPNPRIVHLAGRSHEQRLGAMALLAG